MSRPTPPSPKLLGSVLRSFRERRELSQGDLGYAADLHRNYIGGVEGGERNPTFDALGRWLGALRVSWSEFGEAIDREFRAR